MGFCFQGVLILFLFAISAFFSGIETALFSLSQIGLERLKSRNPKKAILIAKFLRNPSATVNVIITGNILVNVAFSVVWTTIFLEYFGEDSIIWAVVSATLLLLLFGELTPKVVAIANPESFCLYGISILAMVYKVLYPIAKVFEDIINQFLKLIGKDVKLQDLSLSEEELEALLELGEKQGVLNESERDMLEEIMDLDERTVDEIMTPRVDIIGVDVLASWQEVEAIAEQSRHSKLPVYKETIDYVLGYVRVKDVLLNPEKDWRKFMRKALMIPETKTLDKLLEDFKECDEDLAIVIDEYGGTAGLVTVEDIVEELLGNITDEFDKEVSDVVRRSDGALIISGRMSLRDLSEELKIDFDIEDIDTVGGFVMHKIGHLPKGGERFLYKGWIWEVGLVKANRILQVILRPA